MPAPPVAPRGTRPPVAATALDGHSHRGTNRDACPRQEQPAVETDHPRSTHPDASERPASIPVSLDEDSDGSSDDSLAEPDFAGESPPATPMTRVGASPPSPPARLAVEEPSPSAGAPPGGAATTKGFAPTATGRGPDWYCPLCDEFNLGKYFFTSTKCYTCDAIIAQDDRIIAPKGKRPRIGPPVGERPTGTRSHQLRNWQPPGAKRGQWWTPQGWIAPKASPAMHRRPSDPASVRDPILGRTNPFVRGFTPRLPQEI